jgi:hypothetical protein
VRPSTPDSRPIPFQTCAFSLTAECRTPVRSLSSTRDSLDLSRLSRRVQVLLIPRHVPLNRVHFSACRGLPAACSSIWRGWIFFALPGFGFLLLGECSCPLLRLSLFLVGSETTRRRRRQKNKVCRYFVAHDVSLRHMICCTEKQILLSLLEIDVDKRRRRRSACLAAQVFCCPRHLISPLVSLCSPSSSFHSTLCAGGATGNKYKQSWT